MSPPQGSSETPHYPRWPFQWLRGSSYGGGTEIWTSRACNVQLGAQACCTVSVSSACLSAGNLRTTAGQPFLLEPPCSALVVSRRAAEMPRAGAWPRQDGQHRCCGGVRAAAWGRLAGFPVVQLMLSPEYVPQVSSPAGPLVLSSQPAPPPASLRTEGGWAQAPRAGHTIRGHDAHHVEETAVREDARQDLSLQVLGHHLPGVPADGHQHAAGRVLVGLLQLLGGGRKEEWVVRWSLHISHTGSALVGKTATVNPGFGWKTEAEEARHAERAGEGEARSQGSGSHVNVHIPGPLPGPETHRHYPCC